MEIFMVGLIASMFRVATPLIYGSIGEIFSERSGVLNLGIEGTMLLGSFMEMRLSEKESTGELCVSDILYEDSI